MGSAVGDAFDPFWDPCSQRPSGWRAEAAQGSTAKLSLARRATDRHAGVPVDTGRRNSNVTNGSPDHDVNRYKTGGGGHEYSL